MTDIIKEIACAKLNLTLDITGVREDGYHLLSSVMQTIDLHDDIILEKKEEGITLRLICEGNEASGHDTIPEGSDNLVCRAAGLMLSEHGSGGVAITLVKRIPAAAGMGGGSADAAAVLRGINRLYGMGLSDEKLCEAGVKLGADVPFCVMGGTRLCRGIGEVMTELKPAGNISLVYVKPAVDVPTGKIYRMYDETGAKGARPDNEGLCRLLNRGNVTAGELSAYLGNVFEPLAISLHPVIGEIKEALMDTGAAGSLMTGSGPTVFGLYDDAAQARAAAEKIGERLGEIYAGTAMMM